MIGILTVIIDSTVLIKETFGFQVSCHNEHSLLLRCVVVHAKVIEINSCIL